MTDFENTSSAPGPTRHDAVSHTTNNHGIAATWKTEIAAGCIRKLLLAVTTRGSVSATIYINGRSIINPSQAPHKSAQHRKKMKVRTMNKFAIRTAVAAAAIAPLLALGAGTASAATVPDVVTPAARVVPDAGPVTDLPDSGFPWGWPGATGPFGPGRQDVGPFHGGFGGFGGFGHFGHFGGFGGHGGF
ncbi:hypothetical protein ACVH9Z_01645 [Rhodococcus opacus]|uniref:hypothetical protein n=1 Tax=Rhodococcus opacus TaxID=37919 RepID=UPI001848A026|nr:hypothetical protein [Rhodococcus opacus]MBA8961997.1 hypothetical protein [Rhodococcus opacus]MBP2209475.1 hypothetical protein [Rhodococcus opacus]MDJ0415750.1 hypothetical protein [Rhodococcus opacus]MDX5967277.1 hypothetical protein [Rhodococcus opacus]UNM99432.1 hypothetical protein MOO23_27690 [Rhodococcus opacus]